MNKVNKNQFFKYTPIMKEYLLLDYLTKKKQITQREIGHYIGSSVSMVNNYLEQLEKKRYIKRDHYSKKIIDYSITNIGLERKNQLNLWYLKESQKIYQLAKKNIMKLLIKLSEKKKNNIFLYGAGEVAEIILDVIENEKLVHINILGIIDDDIKKINKYLRKKKIINFQDIVLENHDGILISSFTNKDQIYEKLTLEKYNTKNVISLF